MSDPVRAELTELLHLRAAARQLPAGGLGPARAARAGSHRAVWRGLGLEFDEVRAYQPGDDPRTIDWRVTARRGRPHTKRFREERERPVLLLVDLGPGMYFASRGVFKQVQAARLAALLAWRAERHGDRVGGLVYDAHGHDELPPRSRRAGVLALLRALTARQAHAPAVPQRGRLDAQLGRLARVARPGALVVIVSDFSELGEDAGPHLTALGEHADLMAVFVHDPLEGEPPPPGRYHLGDGRRELWLDTGRPAVRERWRQQFAARAGRVHALCRRHRVRLLTCATDADPARVLREGLAR